MVFIELISSEFEEDVRFANSRGTDQDYFEHVVKVIFGHNSLFSNYKQNNYL